nr:disease resistance protein RPM1-like [Ipomoea batatas]
MEGLRLSGYAQLYNYSLENTEHMAECAVVFVLDKITVLLEAKVVLLHGLKHEIEYIKDELERVIAFLGVADTVEDGDAEIKVWVKQVRDVAYDIEDAIDEFMLLPAGHQSSIFCGFLWRFFFSIRNLKPRRKIAYEIQGIKSRVRNIAEGHQRYRYRYHVPDQVSSTSHAYEIANDRRSDALLLEEDEIVGIENPRKELISLLLKEDPTLKVISVVGMGGSGKTTLVKKVYDDAAVKKHFQSHAWITVSQTFKVEEVLKDMIQQLFAELKQPVPEGMSSMNANKLKVIVKEFLLRRRCVIVFDDVWSIRVWEAIKHVLPKEKHGCRVVISTHEETAAWPEKARRLSVHGTLGNVPMKRQGTKLRSLLTFNVRDSQFSSHVVQILSSCRVLKVLELRGTCLEIVPEEIFQLLHLRYLSLRSTKVKVLPRSIKKLRMLEILDLKHTNITELPGAILELQYLRHLLVYGTLPYSYLPYDCSPGFKAPPGIGKLRYLQKLAYIDFNPGSGVIEEIGKLNELKRLCIQKLRTEDGKAMCSSLGKLHKLRSLNLKSIEEDVILDVNYLSSPPPLLQNLYLTGSLRKMPHWIKSLHNLVKVYFRWSKLEDDPLEHLQDLPNLVHLEFLVGYTGETLHFNAGKFRSLRLLNLDKLEELRSVVIDEGAMPHLERLVIQRCSFMERVPVGIECLINLKYLEFFDMPDEFISSFLPDKQGEDYCKVSHIPEVYCTYWKDGFWEVNSLEEKHGSNTSRGPGTAAAKITGRRNSL